MTNALARHPFADEIRLILRAAMVLFVYTVVVGILNGTDLVEFNQKPLLAHVHLGTLGWLTMAVFAGALEVLPLAAIPAIAVGFPIYLAIWWLVARVVAPWQFEMLGALARRTSPAPD